jgi:peptidyl-prolyl cis-trans isomerase B (cyclophilin B)
MTVGGKRLEISLDGAAAPQAVANFLSLTGKSFYTDVSCHRLTTAGIFVLQCGDPNGDGTGGPGYSWGPVENAPADDLYKEGFLAMARRGGDGSSMGSQFFIVYKDSPIPSDEAGGYTVFGKITKGLSGLDKMINAGTEDGSADGKPAIETKLGSITLK